MAKQTIVWTAIPNGRVPDGADAGRLRISIVASPRLTPEAANEQRLRAFPDWVNWPRTLERVRFALKSGADEIELEPAPLADPALWERLLPKTTPVAGFVFRDMSAVNLFSYSVAALLGMTRKHYGRLAVQATGTHPTLLPWREAHPGLKDMLSDCGTRTVVVPISDRRIELPLPGFDRFFDDGGDGAERVLRGQVYGRTASTKAAPPRPAWTPRATPCLPSVFRCAPCPPGGTTPRSATPTRT
ncbi:hypothetical protein [Achromobacter denitrificans]|uniref:hypothetical protein n=1 Tax=Achromobacter denitrificans TaxID=32002 RepID=UPI00240DFF27|nr:hypothetical protein [Achromobacter denitrificans]